MHWKDRRGYSLAELAVVLTISGLILAIGTPGLIRYLNQARVRDSAKVLAEEMRLARQRAVTNGTRNYVYTSYGTPQTQYWTGVSVKQANGSWGGITWRGPIELPSKTKQITGNFNSYVYFFFDPAGRPRTPIDGACSGSVRVTSTLPSITDTSTVNLDLSGSVW